MSLAIFSDCGKYRYTLERPIALSVESWLLWIMLNPSTADAVNNDNTIRKVISYTTSFGYDGALVGNLYAFRATKPWDLWRARGAGIDVVGPLNDEHLNRLACRATTVVLAWGRHGDRDPTRINAVRHLVGKRRDLYELGQTKTGQPVHPLYQPGDLQLTRIA